ncbi:hypothetical protein BH11BAC2_BH11BAC2_20360 [soil metagenome]
METETNKTEENPTGNKKTEKETEQTNPIEAFFNSQLGKLLNSPIVANAALGAYLHWVIDPKGLKASFEKVDKKMDNLIGMMEEQKKEIQILKNRLPRKKRTIEIESNDEDEDLKGIPKAKRKGSFFLD